MSLAAAPLDVGPALREELFEKMLDRNHDQRHVDRGADRVVRVLQIAARV